MHILNFAGKAKSNGLDDFGLEYMGASSRRFPPVAKYFFEQIRSEPGGKYTLSTISESLLSLLGLTAEELPDGLSLSDLVADSDKEVFSQLSELPLGDDRNAMPLLMTGKIPDESSEQKWGNNGFFIYEIVHYNEKESVIGAVVPFPDNMIPLCSYCHSVRILGSGKTEDIDENLWLPVGNHSIPRIGMSHSICPPCYKREVQPELDALKRAQNDS